jgi:type III pantothenate kinase
MQLLVDIGNSRIKWATLDSAGFAAGTPFAWTEADLGSQLQSNWRALPAFASAWISNVGGPGVAREVSAFLADRCRDAPLHWIQSSAVLGPITNAYTEPQRLGVDRLLAMVAAFDRYRGAVCVVDCGTALTIDLVDAGGVFRGGIIAPGPAMMRDALNRGTRQLPLADVDAGSALALDTAAGIAAGCVRAAAGAVTLAFHEYTIRLGKQPKCILTGGAVASLLPVLTMACDHDPHLVLRGVAVLAGSAS